MHATILRRFDTGISFQNPEFVYHMSVEMNWQQTIELHELSKLSCGWMRDTFIYDYFLFSSRSCGNPNSVANHSSSLETCKNLQCFEGCT